MMQQPTLDRDDRPPQPSGHRASRERKRVMADRRDDAIERVELRAERPGVDQRLSGNLRRREVAAPEEIECRSETRRRGFIGKLKVLDGVSGGREFRRPVEELAGGFAAREVREPRAAAGEIDEGDAHLERWRDPNVVQTFSLRSCSAWRRLVGFALSSEGVGIAD